MSIAIHPVHRRLAELTIKAGKTGGTFKLPPAEWMELMHCLQANATLVHKLDGYKEAAYAAQCNDQMDLVQHFTQLLDELEAQLT
ncbi:MULTISPECIES: hypothetical protein [unclassified Paenibacillus]|uniref:DUF7667 family protein n=1 Tax=unclassified Paenibacillus TaxID=185978 RepID=UPI00123A3274|nr:hypothetical protein [Paenibacillus sp. UASWS1643]KAA8750069.1 hypothetical protein FE296_15840 [Paenibacillus sp. UASWS1643]